MLRKIIRAIIIGLAVGVVTLLGQSVLPTQFNFLANSGAIWLIPAFFIAKTDKILNSYILSFAELSTCVVGYYVFEALYNRHSFYFNHWMIVWLGCGVIASFVISFANKFSEKNNIFGKCCMNILPAFFVAESVCHLINISHYRHMVVAIILKLLIGLILYAVINKGSSLKAKNIISLSLVCALGIMFYEILFLVTM